MKKSTVSEPVFVGFAHMKYREVFVEKIITGYFVGKIPKLCENYCKNCRILV